MHADSDSLIAEVTHVRESASNRFRNRTELVRKVRQAFFLVVSPVSSSQLPHSLKARCVGVGTGGVLPDERQNKTLKRSPLNVVAETGKGMISCSLLLKEV